MSPLQACDAFPPFAPIGAVAPVVRVPVSPPAVPSPNRSVRYVAGHHRALALAQRYLGGAPVQEPGHAGRGVIGHRHRTLQRPVVLAIGGDAGGAEGVSTERHLVPIAALFVQANGQAPVLPAPVSGRGAQRERARPEDGGGRTRARGLGM